MEDPSLQGQTTQSNTLNLCLRSDTLLDSYNIAINLHLLLEHGSKKPGVSTFSSSKTVPRSRGSLFKKEKGSATSLNSSHELSLR